ncbi:MAG TPA: ABC transporter ATP-binding protein [Vicinamibacterales bacterium]|nr:ABC transporter ATP-binding protein [Vicinamibacterales bacterium]
MSPIDVTLAGVGKQYRLGTSRSSDRFWAVSDLNLEVSRGASVGIIGPNGAGKSTLMKLLAGITAPTCGRITIVGALSALIEVGSGFHPELTGRENIFLSGSILGMRRREIAARFDAIVAFAGVERFVDTPVKWYSSGMYVRLGFAIAAHLQPDILLVDEVLAVGDAEFQTKCLQRIRELQRQGVTILFISHDLSAVEQLCDRALLMDGGRVVAEGEPTQVVAIYHRRVVAAQKAREPIGPQPPAGDVLKLTNLTFHTPHGGGARAFRTLEPLVVRLRFAAAGRIDAVRFEVAFYSLDGRSLYTTLQSGGLEPAAPGGIVEFVVPSLPLQAGAYYVGAVARHAGTLEVLDWWDGGSTLHVEPSGQMPPGQFVVPHSTRMIRADDPVPSSPAAERR